MQIFLILSINSNLLFYIAIIYGILSMLTVYQVTKVYYFRKDCIKIMTNKKTVSRITAVFSSALLLLFTGCDFTTKIISNSPEPQAVLTSFFTELKEGDYEECDQYLADNVTFVVKDTSEYNFLNDLFAMETENITYEFIGDTKFNGVNASQKVKITTLDINKMTEYMKANVNDAVYEYLVETSEQTFDKENPDHISGAIKQALKDFFENKSDDDFAVSEFDVKFEYSDGCWKIIADEQFISAVFGGTTDTEEESANAEEDTSEEEESVSSEAETEEDKDKSDDEDKKETTKSTKSKK